MRARSRSVTATSRACEARNAADFVVSPVVQLVNEQTDDHVAGDEKDHLDIYEPVWGLFLDADAGGEATNPRQQQRHDHGYRHDRKETAPWLRVCGMARITGSTIVSDS